MLTLAHCLKLVKIKLVHIFFRVTSILNILNVIVKEGDGEYRYPNLTLVKVEHLVPQSEERVVVSIPRVMWSTSSSSRRKEVWLVYS